MWNLGVCIKRSPQLQNFQGKEYQGTSFRSIMDILSGDISQVIEAVSNEIQRPFTVALIGETGTGKTSLLNSLFNLDYPISDNRPCTEDPNIFDKKIGDSTLRFIDLPGYGEVSEIDSSRMKMWKEYLQSADIIVMTTYSISRSLDKDLSWIKEIYSEEFPKNMLIAATHSDRLMVRDGWMITLSGETVITQPTKAIKQLIQRKMDFFQERIIDFTTTSTPVIFCSSASGFGLLNLTKEIYQRIPSKSRLAFSSILTDTEKIGVIPRSVAPDFVSCLYLDAKEKRIIFDSSKFK